MSKEIKLPKGNIFVQKMLGGWFGGWAGYLEYQKSKKIADAMADNEANKVKIAGKIEEKVINERISLIETLESADRFIEYENLYKTLTKAIPKIDLNANGNIDVDKMKRLKDTCKEFSSDEMQELISDILAGEYNNPGSYSINTISTVKNLSKEDIDLFKKFGSIIIDGNFILGKLFQSGQKYIGQLRSEHIFYEDYLYLQELKLISGSNSSQTVPPNKYQLQIGNTKINSKVDQEVTILDKNLLTRAGQELFRLIEIKQSKQAFEICKKELLNIGFIINP